MVQISTNPEPPAEVPFFFGPGLFGTLYRPSSGGLPGWVICSPFGKERTNSHRLEFEFARAMAGRGHWMLRFDYRGTGDSRGMFSEFTIQDYLEDIAVAVNELEEISGQLCRGLMGLRVGGGLAALFSSRSDRQFELVLWEPVVEGSKYRDSLLRVAMANELVDVGSSHRSREDLRRSLAAGEPVSVNGFSVMSPMYESLKEINLQAMSQVSAAPILVVHLRSGRSKGIPSAMTRLSEAFSDNSEVQIESVECPSVWKETRSFKWSLDSLFATTLDWIDERNDSVVASELTLEQKSEPMILGDVKEIPVGFDVQSQRLWGILHKPIKARTDLPYVVLSAAGNACRSAFFYPELARCLAERGWIVLRFDPRGLGDSHGQYDCDWLVDFYHEVETGAIVPDTIAALDFLDMELGPRKSLLIGLCGGAITSIFTAEVDQRVAGIVPLDLPMILHRPPSPDQKVVPRREVPWSEVLTERQSTLFLLKMRRLYHRLRDGARWIRRRYGPRFARRGHHFPGENGWFQWQIGEQANVRLLNALAEILNRGTPVNCVFAENTEMSKYFEAVLPGLQSRRPNTTNSLSFNKIDGADHNFIMPGCTEKLTNMLVSWIEDSRMPWRNP